MSRHTIVFAFLSFWMSVAASADSEKGVVTIFLREHLYTAPATVYVTVAVEPHADNRMLRVELDGDQLSRASMVPLEGDREKRLHSLELKGLPAGDYAVRATLYGTRDVRGQASESLMVTGAGER